MGKRTSTGRVRAFRGREKTKKTNKPLRKSPKSPSERSRGFKARRKALREQLNLPITTNILDASIASFDENPVIGVEDLNFTNSGVASTSENIRCITDQENKPNTAEP